MDNRIKVNLSPYVALLVQGVAKLMNRSSSDTLELLLFRIETAARHGKLEEIGLGLEWTEIASVLNLNGLGATNKDPVLAGGGEKIDFDIELLQKSKRGKTGFEGVYATGSAFRALVPDVQQGGHRYLPSRPTALQAAIDRYEWFEKYGLPYGNLGIFVEERRERHPRETIEQALVQAREFADAPLKYPFTRDQLERTLQRHRELHGLPDDNFGDDPPKPARRAVEPSNEAAGEASEAAPAEPPTLCGACKQPIKSHERIAFYGNGMNVAHSYCLDSKGHPFPPDVLRAMASNTPK